MKMFDNGPIGPRPCYEANTGTGTSTKSAEDYALEIKAKLDESKAKADKALDEVRAIAQKALADAQSSTGVATSTKEKADEALVKMNGLNEELFSLKQRIATGNKGGTGAQAKTWGEQFVETDSFKAFQTAGHRGRATLEAKAILSSGTADVAGAVGDAIRPTRLAEIYGLPQRKLFVRDLLMVGRMDGNALEYVKETGFTNSAAPVAEGARKPESDIKLDLVTTSAKVIAHYMKASRQVVDDISQLRSIIDQRLMYGLKLVEEMEILNGDGTGQHLLGIIPQATAFTPPLTVPTPTSIDNIRLAILQASLALFPASGIVMHPADWCFIELQKDTTGRYIIGNPQGTIPARLWGLPVVETQAMTVDKFLVGAFSMGAQIFDRWAARIEVATENEDDFVKNLLTILAEERLALAVYRPQAFIYGDFGRLP